MPKNSSIGKLILLLSSLCLLGLLTPAPALAAKADGKKAKLIAKYDKNGNGVIDGAEMDAFRKDFMGAAHEELKEFDTDHDGKLSDDEITAIKPGAGAKKNDALTSLLAKYDQNHNGQIDGQEVEALRKDYAATPDGPLKAFDGNHDGKLSDEEIAALKSKATKAERLAALLAKYDKNSNGMIDADEAESVRKAYAQSPGGELKRLDSDKDGKLSDEEIAALKAPAAKKGKGKSKEGKSAKEPKNAASSSQ